MGAISLRVGSYCTPNAISRVVSGHSTLAKAKSVNGGGDALVGGGQRHPDMPGATWAVELTGRGQNAALRQPRDGVAACLAAGDPQIQPGLGMVDGEAGRPERRQQSIPTPAIAIALLALVVVVVQGGAHARLHG